MPEAIDIPVASISTIRKTLAGRTVAIDDDVQGIAKQLQEIDKTLRLQVSEQDGELVWIVMQIIPEPDGSTTEHFVTDMVGDLDHRLLEVVRKVTGRDYNIAAEIDRVEAAADREQNRQHSETMGPIAEKLAHAFRKDFDVKNRIIVPKMWKG